MTREINNMNKMWEIVSKFCFATYPLVVTYLIWLSHTLITIDATYVSQRQLKTVEEKFEEKINKPPVELTQRLEKVEVKLDKMFEEIVALRILLAKINPPNESHLYE